MTAPNSSEDFRRNREHYDRFWSQRWRRTWNYSSQTKIKRFRPLLRRHGLLPGNGWRVFDQGFGLGLMLFSFDRSCSLAGLEISPQAVEAATAVARQRGQAGADFRVFTPGMALPAEWKARFDGVISSHVLEHIADPGPALDDLLALLRPGGHACLVVPINEPPGEDVNHFSLFSEGSFRSFVEGRGMTILECHACDRLWHTIVPVARRAAAGKTLFTGLVLLAFNSVFGFMPAWGLRLFDALLGPFGIPHRQCFIVCRKPL